MKVTLGTGSALFLAITLTVTLNTLLVSAHHSASPARNEATPSLAPFTGVLSAPLTAGSTITTYLPLIFDQTEGSSSPPATEPVLDQATVVAFPGAEGFGAYTEGGRGGRVYVITTLQDYNPARNEPVIPGSLRECVDAVRNPANNSRRTCVFAVGGYIILKNQLRVDKPYLTIAGQTAPGDGITLRTEATNPWGPMKIMTHDVILRYVRLRPGLHPNQVKQNTGESDYNIDALTVGERDKNVYNVIVDHVSLSWGTDEVLNTWYNNDDVSIQWSIMSEPIYCSSNDSLCTGKGPLLGGTGAQDTSFHHNLMAHNRGRNPMIKTGGQGVTDVVNNIMFVPDEVAASVSDEMAKVRANFVGNWVIAPNKADTVQGVYVLGPNTGGFDVYVQDNLGGQRTSRSQPESWFVIPSGRSYVRSTRNPAPQIVTTSPEVAYQQVLASSGAAHRLNEGGEFVAGRDPVDTRIVSEVQARVTRIIVNATYPNTWPTLNSGTAYADSDRDGMADTWENIHFGTLSRGSATDSSADFDNDGYTDLEEFLNGTDPNPAGPPSSPTPAPTNTSTPVPPNTSTPAPTNTPTLVPTNTSTPVSPNTSTPAPTNTPTPVPTHTNTPVPPNTLTPAPTHTNTPVPPNTATPVSTNTPAPVPTNTPVPPNTVTPVPTNTPVPPNTPAPVPTERPIHVNILANPGFELDNNRDNRPDGWTIGGRFTRSNSQPHGGRYVGKHHATNNFNYMISQIRAVTPGGSYTFSGWVHIPNTRDEFTFTVNIVWLNKEGKKIGAVPIKTYSAPTRKWDQMRADVTPPPGAVKASVQMIVTSLKGTIYVDDFNFQQ